MGAAQLFLRHGIQDIALILGWVRSGFQEIAARVGILNNPGIVPSCDTVISQLTGTAVELIKLQKTIAVDAGIRRLAVLIGIDKTLDDILGETFRKIKDIIGHPQTIGDASGIFHILQGAAGAFSGDTGVLVGKKLHGSAGAFVALLLHQKGSDTGIDAAAHGD